MSTEGRLLLGLLVVLGLLLLASADGCGRWSNGPELLAHHGDRTRAGAVVTVIVGDAETQALVEKLQAELAECRAAATQP